MAAVTLSCGHGADVAHTMGERLTHCTAPGCGSADVVRITRVPGVAYATRPAPTTVVAAASEVPG